MAEEQMQPQTSIKESGQSLDLFKIYGALKNKVKSFGGSPKEYNIWETDLDTFQSLFNIPDNMMILMALHRSQGVVSDHVKTLQRTNSVSWTWRQWKEDLAKNFSLIKDEHMASAQITEIKQLEDESIECFSNRFIRILKQTHKE